MKAMLVLEDGSCFEGMSIGVPGEKIGEVILNTAVVGYQEIMTDPQNAGKIVVLTYPLIGNYGIADKFYESRKCWIASLAIKEASRTYSNWQAQGSFGDFLKKENVVAIGDVDTRTIAVTIRDKGEMLGMISAGGAKSKEELLKKIHDHRKEAKPDFIREISVMRLTVIHKDPSAPSIGILDLGVLNSFVKQLKTLGCGITLVPYTATAEEIMAMKFDGLVVSGGPEEDIAIPRIANAVKGILGKLPLLGISTGHEVIALALGGKLRKMKVGHHGVNYPVMGIDSFKGHITVQNHSYVIDENSIKNKKGIKITLRNINDNSVEEIESRQLKLISAQYYPSSPGFDETNALFTRFLKMMPDKKGSKVKSKTATSNEVRYAKA